MARGRKKGPKTRQNATGDSRVSVLTEENDNYNPFKDIKRMDAVEKVDSPTKQKKSNSKVNKEKIIEIDENVSFEDIFNQWENVGTLNSKKKNKTKEEKENFAEIFNKWEVSQGIKSKYSKKAKDSPNRKKSNYVPKKDFSQILDEFEGKPVEKKVQEKVNSQTKEKKENESIKISETKKEHNSKKFNSNLKVKSVSDKKESKYEPKRNFAEILNEFENKPNEKKVNKEKKEFEIKPQTFVKEVKENLIIDDKAKSSSEKKSQNFKKESVNEDKKNKPQQKEEAMKSQKKDFGQILDTFDSKNSNKESSKIEQKEKTNSKNKKEFNKNQYSGKKNNWKEHSKNSDSEKESYQKKNRDKKNYRSPDSSVSSKWNFSDIYGAWESKNNESKEIEEKKKSEKKDNKGISISYLRSMSPEAELDLHGYTSDIAALKVSEFLNDSRAKGFKKVSIITGKGNHSENGKSVIKDLVLEEIKYSDIVREAYHPKAVHGGSGAIWVIFKSKSEKKIYF